MFICIVIRVRLSCVEIKNYLLTYLLTANESGERCLQAPLAGSNFGAFLTKMEPFSAVCKCQYSEIF